jgi:diguanylate cyclase (GGDEF)-like protein
MVLTARSRLMGAGDAPAHRKVAVLGFVLLALMTCVGAVGAISVRSIQHDLEVLVDDDGRVLHELQSLHQFVLRAQLALEEASTTRAGERTSIVAAFDQALALALPRWDEATNDPENQFMSTDADDFNTWVVQASKLRDRIAKGEGTVDLTEIRNSFATLTTSFEADILPLVQSVETTAQKAQERAAFARKLLFATAALGLAIGMIFARSSYRAASAQHREINERDAERLIESQRSQTQARVGQAMDYARTDTDALDAAQRALAELYPGRPTELLLADSSKAHFEVALRTPGHEGHPGCPVPNPAECPAVARGQTLVFTSSERFDACPHLHDRPSGPVSAACVPVSIGGAAEGVLHSTGVDGERPDQDTRRTLELIAGRTGDRIGVLRAFNRSEVQAATDQLTGLANRRSFENKVSAMLRTGVPVAIAFGDLDHFKQLNDAHGHDAGDRALRTFARTFRDVIRPGDLIARWGGEEFVAAFPNTDKAKAADVLTRVQSKLAAVVAQGAVAPFTASFGVADNHDGDDLHALVTVADQALMTAKRDGRNRVVVATSYNDTDDEPVPTSPRLASVVPHGNSH